MILLYFKKIYSYSKVYQQGVKAKSPYCFLFDFRAVAGAPLVLVPLFCYLGGGLRNEEEHKGSRPLLSC